MASPYTNTAVIGDPSNTRLMYGRLVAVPSISQGSSPYGNDWDNAVTISLPRMPPSLKLARTAEYYVSSNIVLPDGIHQYRGTKPLEFPISFTVNASDKTYCKKDALTLLEVAARLHSFILPIADDAVNYSAQQDPTPATGSGTDASQQASAGATPVFSASSDKNAPYPPVTCWLFLTWLSENLPGISCIGYVKDVSVDFKYPDGKSRIAINGYGLPEAAEYSFTFVHNPGRSNNTSFKSTTTMQQIGVQTQATARYVRDHFYNTRGLGNYQVGAQKGLD